MHLPGAIHIHGVPSNQCHLGKERWAESRGARFLWGRGGVGLALKTHDLSVVPTSDTEQMGEGKEYASQ